MPISMGKRWSRSGSFWLTFKQETLLFLWQRPKKDGGRRLTAAIQSVGRAENSAFACKTIQKRGGSY